MTPVAAAAAVAVAGIVLAPTMGRQRSVSPYARTKGIATPAKANAPTAWSVKKAEQPTFASEVAAAAAGIVLAPTMGRHGSVSRYARAKVIATPARANAPTAWSVRKAEEPTFASEVAAVAVVAAAAAAAAVVVVKGEKGMSETGEGNM